jgi:hypothetical protein
MVGLSVNASCYRGKAPAHRDANLPAVLLVVTSRGELPVAFAGEAQPLALATRSP